MRRHHLSGNELAKAVGVGGLTPVIVPPAMLVQEHA